MKVIDLIRKGSKNLLHGWARVLGGRGGDGGSGDQDGRTRVLPGREGGDHSSPRSFSEGVAALRAGLTLIVANISQDCDVLQKHFLVIYVGRN